MSHRTLNSVPVFSTDIGFYLSGMEEVREQLREAVEGMSEDQISRPAIPGAHSIAALVLHIGEAEWWWIQSILTGHKVTDEIRSAPEDRRRRQKQNAGLNSRRRYASKKGDMG